MSRCCDTPDICHRPNPQNQVFPSGAAARQLDRYWVFTSLCWSSDAKLEAEIKTEAAEALTRVSSPLRRQQRRRSSSCACTLRHAGSLTYPGLQADDKPDSVTKHPSPRTPSFQLAPVRTFRQETSASSFHIFTGQEGRFTINPPGKMSG